MIQLDRSLPFSTVHGDRTPGDPHQGVEYFQNGLPFDAHGGLVQKLIDADPDGLGKKLAALQRRKEKAKVIAELAGEDEGEVEEAITPTSANAGDEVNLEAWLLGKVRYRWFAISAAIHKRKQKRVTNQDDAIYFLVHDPTGPHVVPPQDVHPSLLPSREMA